MESTGVPGRIHISGATACYLEERKGALPVELEDGSIRPDVEEQKARPTQDYDKLLEDLQERYNESNTNNVFKKLPVLHQIIILIRDII